MLKELFQDLWFKAQEAAEVRFYDEKDGRRYSTRQLVEMTPPAWPTLHVSTLDAATVYYEDIDEEEGGPSTPVSFFLVESPTSVKVISDVYSPSLRRAVLCQVTADIPASFPFGNFLELEDFLIKLQTSFKDEGDRAKILGLLGTVKSESGVKATDDGFSQQVEVKKGVALAALSRIENPVTLQPYRTFAEVEQPSSPFVLRLKSATGSTALTAALFEADGGKWRLDAKKTIAEYLKAHSSGRVVV